jgi:hypothetical protein
MKSDQWRKDLSNIMKLKFNSHPVTKNTKFRITNLLLNSRYWSKELRLRNLTFQNRVNNLVLSGKVRKASKINLKKTLQ